MPLKRMREELELVNKELAVTEPDLGFLLVHIESMHEHARAAASGRIYDDTAPEDRILIERYVQSKSRSPKSKPNGL